MSVELIRSITVKKGEVYVTCASSNVFPRTYHTIVDEKGTQELKEGGLELAELPLGKTRELSEAEIQALERE